MKSSSEMTTSNSAFDLNKRKVTVSNKIYQITQITLLKKSNKHKQRLFVINVNIELSGVSQEKQTGVSPFY